MKPFCLYCACLFLILWNSFAASAGVVVHNVEPPNWWAGHSQNPVRLMLTGEQLGDAKVEPPSGFAVSNLVVNAAGTSLFCDLFIPGDAAPSPRELSVKSPAGETSVSFTISPRLTGQGQFAGFSPDDVIYLLMPDRFANGDLTNDDPAVSHGLLDRTKPRHYHGGDFQGVISHLPYLRDLGVTALWLTPWYDNANQLNRREKYTHDNKRSAAGNPVTDYHGYGAVDFYTVEEHFGDMAKLRELVNAAHAGGFKIIQDQVANHTGPYHPWVKNPPTSTWFNGSAENHLDNSWQTWTLAHTNPPQDLVKSTLEGWFINILPDLNQNDPETSTYLIQNSLWWIGMTGLDAVRQDTLPYVPRTYWAHWTAALKKEHPQLIILGEMWDAKPELVAFFQGGRKQFDGVDSGVETLFDFPLYFAIRDVFAKRASMNHLAQVLAADTNYVNPRVLVTFLGLHDTPRFLHETGATVEGLQLAFTFLLTVRGTPLIYYGDEIAMHGGGDPDNRRDFPGGWREDKHNAFQQSERTVEEERVHAHVRKLTALRRELEPLRRGNLVQLDAGDSTLAFARVTENSGIVVAFNNSAHPQTMSVPITSLPIATEKELFNRLGNGDPLPVRNGIVTVELAARSAAILVPQPSNLAKRTLRSADSR